MMTPTTSRSKTSTLHLLLIAVALLIGLSTNLQVTLAGIQVSKEFTAAFDAAIQDLVADPVWTAFYSDNMILPVPQCTTKAVWPTKDPFVGRTSLNMCFETGTLTPWLEVKTELANSVVRKVNARYKTSYKTEILRFDTAKLGFFDTLRVALENGTCDMITANTRPSVEREAVVHFQCGFGVASKGWIRSARDPQIIMNDVLDLNRTGIRIGAYDGTAYATFVKNDLTAATYVPFKAVNLQYQSVLDKTVHALIGDAIQFYNWQKQMNGTCNCVVKAYDAAYGLSTFTAGNITATSGAGGISGISGFSSMIPILIISFMVLLQIVL